MRISTNNGSDNNDKNILVDQLDVEHTKEQEIVDNDNELEIKLGMKITIDLDIYIIAPVAIVTKELNKQCTAVFPCGKIHD